MTRKAALHLALAAAFPASAVTLNPDGLGQALIYPYYTAQSVGNDGFNAYLSVVNHSSDAKALRLRFREGRLGKPTLDMNLYLSPNDVWTGAVIPFSTGTRLISADNSCTEPRFAVTVAPGEAPFIDFRNDAFSGLNDDGAGTGLDRTREGFVEIIEMATLTGTSAAAVTHNSAGVPANCGSVAGWSPSVSGPGGGLSGTLTLINVASGLDFTVNAEALDQLASRPFFRLPSDPYPGFNAAEIDRVSVVDANGATYRSTWDNPVDAVSAVLMRDQVAMEFILDRATASFTDGVMTLPTRHFHTNATAAAAPFTTPGRWGANCSSGPTLLGERLTVIGFTREEQSIAVIGDCGFPECPPNTQPNVGICAASGVFSVWNTAFEQFNGVSTARTTVFGSVGGFSGGRTSPVLFVAANSFFSNGWLRIRTTGTEAAAMVSGPQSSMLRHSTGAVTVGPHTFAGLPMTGFSARIFRNGTLRCDAGACQGNYGGAFPFKYRRTISPAP